MLHDAGGAVDTPAERFEVDQFLFLLEEIVLHQFAPDMLFTYGGHPLCS